MQKINEEIWKNTHGKLEMNKNDLEDLVNIL